MELLIPGLILVALMVYASTRIKRSAARAFEAEYIEGDGFELKKPEGFLHRLGENAEFEFEAYSKEFGGGVAADVRAATAVVRKRNAGLRETENTEAGELSNSTNEKFELNGNQCSIIRGEAVRDGHVFDAAIKTFETGGRTFTLRIEVLKELSDAFALKIETMLDSFGPL
jgi:hypothetical protein